MSALKAMLHQSSSLRRVLLLPYVLLILALSLVIGLFSYQAGSQSVEEVAEHLIEEIAQRIGLTVQQQLGGTRVALGAAVPNELTAPQNLREEQRLLIERFWIATGLNPDINHFVYYGNQRGMSFSMLRRSGDTAELLINASPSEPRRVYRLQGMLGTPESVDMERIQFDPRQRPWYQAATQARHDVWTPVYIDIVSSELVLTRARALRWPDGRVEGVVATDVFLRMFNHFVHNLDISPNGLAFIVEPDGALIASSKGPNVILERHIGAQRMYAQDDHDPLLRAAYAEVRQRLDASSAPQLQASAFSFETADGKTMHAAFRWVRDDAGLSWLTVVAVPRSDFMGDVAANAIRTAVVALVAVLIALLLGFYIGEWILADITRLSIAAGKIGRGQFDVRLRLERRDEIGRLAREFDSMRTELSTDRLTGLRNRTALMRQLEFAIERQRNGEPDAEGFALLFIDLNRFKAINDTHGHEAGDQALIEVAGRLREAVRHNDLVARLGGDEFVIVLWNSNSRPVIDQVLGKLERLLNAPLERLAELDPHITVGASVGVALYPQDGVDAESLLKQADQQMYSDKRNRRGEGRPVEPPR